MPEVCEAAVDGTPVISQVWDHHETKIQTVATRILPLNVDPAKCVRVYFGGGC